MKAGEFVYSYVSVDLDVLRDDRETALNLQPLRCWRSLDQAQAAAERDWLEEYTDERRIVVDDGDDVEAWEREYPFEPLHWEVHSRTLEGNEPCEWIAKATEDRSFVVFRMEVAE
jgi:hypothetical protein